ncbi:MAG: hypothetical protein EOP49_19255 [Sphingobacteriales bacterium]|nr:MAG: hypothetical protein EOP49_19255 [Sphingobacteriales bacterium]
MKPLFFALLIMLTLGGCKKIIDKQKENFVLSVMTEGQWVMTKFVSSGDTLTSEFSPYTFQFNRDYTVEAIKENVVESKGTWNGDPENANISASFPTATIPVQLINGTWHIDRNSLSYVEASQGIGGEKLLRLDKK